MFSEQIQDKLIDIGNMVLKRSVLDNKTKALIALSTAVAAYCIHCHTQSKSIAKNFGATEEEIEEIEAIALRMRQKCQNEFDYLALKPIETPKLSEFEGR